MSGENSGIKLPKEQVCKAIDALYAVIKQKQNVKKLLGETEKINLQFCFKKIPDTKNITIKINIPHPLTQETTEVCLFAKDVDKKHRDYEPTVRHFKELLSKHGIKCVTEVIPLKSLKLEYKPFEAKRKLSNIYDLFLADDRIVRLLPSLLGKNFYGRKRNPVPVNMQAKDLKKEISDAVDNTRCYITGKGSSCMVTIAHTAMAKDEIVDNILASVDQLSVKIPGGPNNIKLFSIKTLTSASIPLYASTGSIADVQLPKKTKSIANYTSMPEEITTLKGAKVKVRADGKIFIVKNGSTFEERSGLRSRKSLRKTEDKKFNLPLMISGTRKTAKKRLSKSGKKDKKRSLQKSSTVKKAKTPLTSSNAAVVKGTLGESPASKKRRTDKVQ